jgi:protein SCO1
MEIAPAPAPVSAQTERVPALLLAAWWAITLGWWGLAFLSLTPATPSWLARTQSVCFGTLANGLPDTYGWMRLLLAPLGLLVPLLVVHGRPLRGAVWALARGLLGRGLLLAVLCVTLAEGAWIGARVRAGLALEALPVAVAAEALPEGYPRQARPAPEFRLLDQHGAAVSVASLRGQVVYLTFAFAHCSSTCPLTVHSLVQAARETAALGARPVVVTLDPWRDTPSALPALARQWGLQGLGSVLSGSVPQVLGVLARFDVPSERDAQTGNIVHPALVYVLDREGRIAYVFNNPPPGWIAEAGRRAAAG